MADCMGKLVGHLLACKIVLGSGWVQSAARHKPAPGAARKPPGVNSTLRLRRRAQASLRGGLRTGPTPMERASAWGEGYSSLKALASITRPLCRAIRRRNTPSVLSSLLSEAGLGCAVLSMEVLGGVGRQQSPPSAESVFAAAAFRPLGSRRP